MSGQAPRLSILLVDDSEDDTQLARVVFGQLSLPHELRALNSGAEALAYLRREGRYAGARHAAPDLILLDLHMPGMSGLELLRALKEDAVLRRIPVVMLTSSAAPADIKASFESGAASYLNKPATLEGYKELMAGFGSYWLTVSLLPQ